MILSHKEIEEIAAAVTKDFNEFFFGPDTDRKSTRLNSSHNNQSRMPSSA